MLPVSPLVGVSEHICVFCGAINAFPIHADTVCETTTENLIGLCGIM